ncbi:MAG: apolipoprotein N-acyltransferase [Elusimicrobia bacterium]|nr:apolipoprotein N-acyltransferase [Elusimicrobiota bacterium]
MISGWCNYFLPILSAVLLILCFPKPDVGWLAWVALVPLLRFLFGPRTWRLAFGTAYAAGCLFYGGLLYWIYFTCRAGGVSPLFSFLAWAALSALLALDWGIFGAGVFFFKQELFVLLLRLQSTWALFWRGVAFAAIPFFLAALWTSLEFIKARFLWRFPWELLGYSQWRYPLILQMASVTGVYGLTFLIVWINAAVTVISFGLSGSRKVWAAVGGAPLVCLILCWMYGFAKLSGAPSDFGPGGVSVAILQPNIFQYQKWTPSFEKEIQDTLKALSVEAAGKGAKLVVWPESSVPGLFEDPPLHRWVKEVVRRTHTDHLIGAVTRISGKTQNAAFLVLSRSPGSVIHWAAKRQLVPFGEYVPFKFILERWIPVLNELGAISPGGSPGLIPSRAGTLGVSICYESIFPHLASGLVRKGADVLVNLTNDGWYLDTAGPYQHFSMNVLRAVENRRFLLRSANTGISAVIDPWGRISSQTALGQKSVLSFSLPRENVPEASLYTRFGDWFGYFCILACVSYFLLNMKWT